MHNPIEDADLAQPKHPWSEETHKRILAEHKFPEPDYVIDRHSLPKMDSDTFDHLRGVLEDAMPHLTAWQLMTLHSSIGWERDIRSALHSEEYWQPWTELRQRLDVEFRWCYRIDTDLSDHGRAIGMFSRNPRTGRSYICLNWSAGDRSLTHELTHEDRPSGDGGYDLGAPDSWERQVEEQVVQAITRERIASKAYRTAAPSIDRVTGEGSDR